MTTPTQEPKTIGMRMAKASRSDMDSAMALYRLLNAVEDGSFPPDDEDEDWPEFDPDSKDDLLTLHEKLMAAFSNGGLMRVLMAAEALLCEKNALLDPDKDHLEHHPSIAANKAGHEEARRLLAALCEKLLKSHDGIKNYCARDELRAARVFLATPAT